MKRVYAGRKRMPRRLTKEIKYIRLPEERIHEIRDLVASWPYEIMVFMRARLNQYRPPSDVVNTVLEWILSLFTEAPKKKFDVLKNPDYLTDWQKRFEISGQTNPQEAWNKILEKYGRKLEKAGYIDTVTKEPQSILIAMNRTGVVGLRHIDLYNGLKTQLENGDIISIYPPLMGG